MTERTDKFYGDVLNRLGRVFGSYDLDQAECVAICAQLMALCVYSNGDQSAQPDQLEKAILIIRERYRVLATD